MRNTIINYIRAGYPGIYLVSFEETRIEAELKAIAQALDYLWVAETSSGNEVVDSAGFVPKLIGHVAIVSALLRYLLCWLRPQHDLALKHQITVLNRQTRKPKLRP